MSTSTRPGWEGQSSRVLFLMVKVRRAGSAIVLDPESFQDAPEKRTGSFRGLSDDWSIVGSDWAPVILLSNLFIFNRPWCYFRRIFPLDQNSFSLEGSIKCTQPTLP